MPASLPSDTCLHLPINQKRTRPELQYILKAIGGQQLNFPKEKLIGLIFAILADEGKKAELARDPKLQALVSEGGNKASGAVKTVATSSEKDRSDAEAARGHANLKDNETGAARTLRSMGATSDPPANHFKLTAASGQLRTTSDDSADQAQSGFKTPTKDSRLGGEVDTEDLRKRFESMVSPGTNRMDPKVTEKGKIGGVTLSFVDFENPNQSLYDVLIDGERLQLKEEDEFGRVTMSLQELVPLAMEKESPIKNRGGRLYRQGVQDPDAKTPLGRIEDMDTPNKAKVALKINKLHRIGMDYNYFEDSLSVKLFLKQAAANTAPAPAIAAAPTVANSDRTAFQSAPPTAQPPILPVAEQPTDATEPPTPPAGNLDEAEAEPERQATLDETMRWMNRNLGKRIGAWLPVGDDQWPMAKNAGEYRARAKAIVLTLEWLHRFGFEKTGGGYRVPKTMNTKKYCGVNFTMDHLCKGVFKMSKDAVYFAMRPYKPGYSEYVPGLRDFLTNLKQDNMGWGNMKQQAFTEMIKKMVDEGKKRDEEKRARLREAETKAAKMKAVAEVRQQKEDALVAAAAKRKRAEDDTTEAAGSEGLEAGPSRKHSRSETSVEEALEGAEDRSYIGSDDLDFDDDFE